MFKEIKYWFKHTLKTNTTVKVYQVWIIIIVEFIIILSVLSQINKTRRYKAITEDDRKISAINCYETRKELRCYEDIKVKQYGRVR